MIPKKIHFCWLSGDSYPRKIRECMDTWRKVMPDYELKLWNTHNFDIDGSPDYVREAYAMRKWAFASDYIRMYALYHEGGIYLDSDVMVLKPFDCFLNHTFFTSLEYHPRQIERMGAMDMIKDGKRIKDGYVSGIQLQAAVMGAEAGSPFVGDVLDWYDKQKFIISENGDMATDVISPYVYARIAEKYGFIYKDMDQELDGGMKVYRSEIFAGNKHEVTPESYAIHYCAHSWHPSAKEKILKAIKKIF